MHFFNATTTRVYIVGELSQREYFLTDFVSYLSTFLLYAHFLFCNFLLLYLML